MYEACDGSAPTVRNRPVRRKAHWWSDEIAEVRAECIRAQRNWSRNKRRRNTDETTRLNNVYMRPKGRNCAK